MSSKAAPAPNNNSQRSRVLARQPVQTAPLKWRMQSLLCQFIFHSRFVPITLVLFHTGWQESITIVVAFILTTISFCLDLMLFLLYSSNSARGSVPPIVFMVGYGFTAVLGVVELIMYGLRGFTGPENILLLVSFAYTLCSVVATLLAVLMIFLVSR
ncbi:unnamed protein product [Bursaphelenchus okinawaensis]|uniref:Uncharacterized protein n=1 Tax=Bursaphelenchus okinawaensis TaxID=465554 RepID=A0A811JW01_9BILA|nr:unnamed protein product [Bursaphelenchus okinawaensis]CAG9085631.1 unnamed protein product [Bursaphelenchus okinawaensis]